MDVACCVISEVDDSAGTDEKVMMYSGTDDAVTDAESIET